MDNIIYNDEQINCMNIMQNFIKNNIKYSKLLLNASAGVGKTTLLIASIINNILLNAVSYKQQNSFIIAAPTHKALDILRAKYYNYIACMSADTQSHIATGNIIFQTVAQLLSINKIINELGEETFSKGNIKKVAAKYNNISFSNTYIIIDECSMLETNTVNILENISCPILYLGDSCQINPINENLSQIFNLEKISQDNTPDNTIQIIKLCKVMRCTNYITIVANQLRDMINNPTLEFNLLKFNTDNIIFYKKQPAKWLNIYINDIKTRQHNISVLNSIPPTDNNIPIDNKPETAEAYIPDPDPEPEDPDNNKKINKKVNKIMNDTMLLAWTNKCCNILNKKIRSILFIDNISTNNNTVNDIDECFLRKGDKILIKTPYYKYGYKICSSSIAYVTKIKHIKYKPLSFSEWNNVGISILQNEINSKSNIININNIINNDDITEINAGDTNINNFNNINYVKKTLQSNINNYFKKTSLEVLVPATPATLTPATPATPATPDANCVNNTGCENIEHNKHDEHKELNQITEYRTIFYKFHNLQFIISTDLYNFNDDISLKYNNLINNINLLEIKLLPTKIERERAYKIWHSSMSIILFNMPIDNKLCKKCLFFIKKFTFNNTNNITNFNYKTNINEMDIATTNINFNILLCDLTTLGSFSQNNLSSIPILDTTDNENLAHIDNIKNIIKNSYEIRLPLNKSDARELYSINKILNEDSGNTDKYVTLSQLFGHYLSHVITNTYIEVDYGYALTVHKSQGSTYDDVYIEYNNILSNTNISEKNKLLYTAITRCSNNLHVYY